MSEEDRHNNTTVPQIEITSDTPESNTHRVEIEMANNTNGEETQGTTNNEEEDPGVSSSTDCYLRILEELPDI